MDATSGSARSTSTPPRSPASPTSSPSPSSAGEAEPPPKRLPPLRGSSPPQVQEDASDQEGRLATAARPSRASSIGSKRGSTFGVSSRPTTGEGSRSRPPRAERALVGASSPRSKMQMQSTPSLLARHGGKVTTATRSGSRRPKREGDADGLEHHRGQVERAQRPCPRRVGQAQRRRA